MIFQSLKMAWSSIASNKMRSFLTMLGIIIGVVSLVVLVSLANSATSSVTDEISSIGTNLLTVNISDDKGNPLKLSELSDFAESDQIDLVAPLAQTSATGKYDTTSESVTIYGTTPSYADIQGLEMERGRFLKTTDIDNNSYVVVLNQTAATDIMGSTDVVGQEISLDGRKFLIIGVLASESTASSTNENLEVYIPYTTIMRIAQNISSVTTFYASSSNEETLDLAESELTMMLMERFSQDEDAFTVVNQSTLLETMESVQSTFTLMLGGIAAISLLVGGIGIMNIMLVSVTERTKEIGIRKAIGAGRGSIMLQFLIEALMVSLMGCAAGILLSAIIVRIASVVVDSMTFSLSFGVVLVAVLFSLVIGVLFGIYPANKAAKKHPIEALRFTG
ncbi:MAG: ABC transporter permease [Lachnospiraceae bacterium]